MSLRPNNIQVAKEERSEGSPEGWEYSRQTVESSYGPGRVLLKVAQQLPPLASRYHTYYTLIPEDKIHFRLKMAG